MKGFKKDVLKVKLFLGHVSLLLDKLLLFTGQLDQYFKKLEPRKSLQILMGKFWKNQPASISQICYKSYYNIQFIILPLNFLYKSK